MRQQFKRKTAQKVLAVRVSDKVLQKMKEELDGKKPQKNLLTKQILREIILDYKRSLSEPTFKELLTEDQDEMPVKVQAALEFKMEMKRYNNVFRKDKQMHF